MLVDDRISSGWRRTVRPSFAHRVFLFVLGATIVVLGSFVTIKRFFQTLHRNNIPQWKGSKHLGIVDQSNPVSFHEGDSGVGWEQIKRHMCPQGVPRKAIGSKLFAMASVAMNKSASYDHLDKFLQRNQTMATKFYHGFFDKMDVYADDLSKLAYVRIFKCGNNFIRRWLEKVAEELSNTHSAAFSASTVKEFLAIDDRRPYCVITAIRDPISHFLSGYNEMEFRVWSRKTAPHETRMPPAFLSLPYTTPTEREERFRQFVSDILFDRWSQFDGLPKEHVFSMSRVLSALSDHNLTLNAVLPSMQNLTTRFPEFVRTSCPHFPLLPETFYVNERMGQHESSSDPVGFYAAAKSVWSRQGRVAKAQCVIHAMDYACWDNLPDGIPPLCQMLFAKDSFVKAVLTQD